MNQAFIPHRAGSESEFQEPRSEVEVSKLLQRAEKAKAQERFHQLVGVFFAGLLFGAAGMTVVYLLATAVLS